MCVGVMVDLRENKLFDLYNFAAMLCCLVF